MGQRHVAGLGAGPPFTTFELVDYEPDGTTVASVLSIGAYAAHARQIRATLDSAGAPLADGLR